MTAARQKLSLLLSTAPPSYCNKCGEMFLLDNVADAAFTMYYGVEVVRYFLLLMLFLFLSKLSERSERGLGSPDNSIYFTPIDSKRAGLIGLKLDGMIKGIAENVLTKEFLDPSNLTMVRLVDNRCLL